MRCQNFSLLLLVLIGLLSSLHIHPARADEAGEVCSVQFENDMFGSNTDRHFTHGTRFSCVTQPIPWFANAIDNIPWFSTQEALKTPQDSLLARGSLSIGQNIYTPEDIRETELIEEDRPYGGWLYLGIGLVGNQGSQRYDKVELNIGVVGPWSLADDVQREWHALFGFDKPEGWDHQLKNELGMVLFYEQARRFAHQDVGYGLQYDVIPHFGGALGNVFTHASAGCTIRLGPDLDEDFGPPRIRPSLPGGGYFRNRKGLNWYLFAGGEARVVLHNIFLDGNTFKDSHSVDKKWLVGDMQAGLSLQIGRLRLTYTQIYRTREYKKQNSPDAFGSVSLSYQF
jgi:hypothetical protein